MKNLKNRLRNFSASVMAGSLAAASFMTGTAYADDFGQSVTVTGDGATLDGMMGKIIGFVLTIFRYVGAFLIVFGIYEINDSTQTQYA